MKQENAQKRNSMKWFAVLGMVVMVLVGIMVTSSGLSWGRLLSQFSGNGVTPATASSKWQPSVGNPNRAKVATYSTRLDAIIVRILARWSALTASGFKSYIANLSDGIVAIGAKPEYADDQDIKDVVAYLTYELNDAKTTLSMGGAFFADITNLVEGTGGSTGVVSGGSMTSTGSVSGGTQSNNTNTQASTCANGDIQIGNQTWAGCNSVLWNGSEYLGTAGSTDLGTNTIAGKYYTWDNQNSACPAGWKVPSRDDFKTLFATLGCTAYNPGYATSVICPWLWWTGGGNTLAKALKIPLAGYKDTRFSPNSLHRWAATYLATSTLYENDASMRRSINIDKNSDKLDEYASPKTTEYSVRCLKITSATSTTNTTSTSQANNTNTSGNTTTTQGNNTTTNTQSTPTPTVNNTPICSTGDTNNWNCNSASKLNPRACLKDGNNTALENSDGIQWGNGGSTTDSQKAYIQAWKNSDATNLAFNDSTGVATWGSASLPSAKCKIKYAVAASCGSNAGKNVYENNPASPDNCAVGTFKKTYQYNGGTQFEPYYDFVYNSWSGASMTFKYTCGGLNGGADVECKTGEKIVDGTCGATPLTCTSGTLVLNDEKSTYDAKRFQDGNFNWQCVGYENGANKTPTNCQSEAYGQNPVCGSTFFQSSSVAQSLGSAMYGNGSTTVNYDFNPNLLCDLPTWLTTDGGKFVTPIDLVGTDGRYDWKCSGVDRFGKPSSETTTCGVTRLIPGECGSNHNTTLASVASDSDFYQSWGGPITLKYCKIGYPHYIDQTGADGDFNWTCDVQYASKTYCKATKG